MIRTAKARAIALAKPTIVQCKLLPIQLHFTLQCRRSAIHASTSDSLHSQDLPLWSPLSGGGRADSSLVALGKLERLISEYDRYGKIKRMPPWSWAIPAVFQQGWRRWCSWSGKDRGSAGFHLGQCRFLFRAFKAGRRVDRDWWFRRHQCPHFWKRWKLSWSSHSVSWVCVREWGVRDMQEEYDLLAYFPAWLCWEWGRSLLFCTRWSAESLMIRELRWVWLALTPWTYGWTVWSPVSSSSAYRRITLPAHF